MRPLNTELPKSATGSRLAMSLCACLALSACSGASFETEVAGQDFVARSAVHFETDNNRTRVLISNRKNLCDRLLEDDADIAEHQLLVLNLSDIEISGFDIDFNPLTEGDYDIREGLGDFEGRGSDAFYIENDDDCDASVSNSADEGEIIIDRFDDEGTVSGSIDIEFDNEDTIGTFTAHFCEIDDDDANRDDDECDP